MTQDIPIPKLAPTLASWVGFIAMCIGMFMAILDIQIVATSLPDLQRALAIRPEQMSWIQASYLIAEVIAIPLTGWLTRVLSLRGLFVIATSVFVIASVACAASVGFASLVSARVFQGFAGGLLIPIVFSAGFLLFPVRGQSLATTIAGALAVLAMINRDPVQPYVFPSEDGRTFYQGTKRFWAKIVKRAKLPGVTPHTLRHTLGSASVSTGETLAMTGALLGHADHRSTSIYAHMQNDPARRAADRVVGPIANALGSPTAVVIDLATRKALG